MTAFVLAGILVSTLASLLVGTRLLILAARSRGLPELCLGLALAGSGGLGVLLSFLGRVFAGPLGELSGWLLGVSQVCVLGGPIAVGLFNWRVFRAESLLAAFAFAALSAVLGVVWLGHLATVGFRDFPQSGSFFWIGYAARLSAYAWSAAEASLCFAQLRRRRALGLANPVVSNRVLLWAITMAVAVYMHLPFLAREAGLLPSREAERLLLAAGGVATALGLWLAFFPPRSYLRRVEAGEARPLAP
jgi:hypothetical protein